MAGPSAQFHEDTNILKPETRDRHRAIASVIGRVSKQWTGPISASMQPVTKSCARF